MARRGGRALARCRTESSWWSPGGTPGGAQTAGAGPGRQPSVDPVRAPPAPRYPAAGFRSPGVLRPGAVCSRSGRRSCWTPGCHLSAPAMLLMPLPELCGVFCRPIGAGGMQYGAFGRLPLGAGAAVEGAFLASRPPPQATPDDWFLPRGVFPGGDVAHLCSRLLLGSPSLGFSFITAVSSAGWAGPGAFSNLLISGQAARGPGSRAPRRRHAWLPRAGRCLFDGGAAVLCHGPPRRRAPDRVPRGGLVLHRRPARLLTRRGNSNPHHRAGGALPRLRVPFRSPAVARRGRGEGRQPRVRRKPVGIGTVRFNRRCRFRRHGRHRGGTALPPGGCPRALRAEPETFVPVEDTRRGQGRSTGVVAARRDR